MAPEFAFTFIERQGVHICLWLHTAEEPTAAAWAIAMASLRALLKDLKGDQEKMRVLVITDGGAPNSAQRAEMRTEGATCVRLATITPSVSHPVKRVIMKAITWFQPFFAGFACEDWRLALRHLRLPEDFASLQAPFLELQRSLPPVSALDAVFRAAGLTNFMEPVSVGRDLAARRPDRWSGAARCLTRPFAVAVSTMFRRITQTLWSYTTGSPPVDGDSTTRGSWAKGQARQGSRSLRVAERKAPERRSRAPSDRTRGPFE